MNMYTGLCECCSKPNKDCTKANIGPRPLSAEEDQSNRFNQLFDSSISEDDADNFERVPVQCRSRAITVGPTMASQKNGPRLVDDQLGDACELCKSFEVNYHLMLVTLMLTKAIAANERASACSERNLGKSCEARMSGSCRCPRYKCGLRGIPVN